ncbi:hypothetical protein AMTR_s00017p00253730 [Amborella trichopoda]|uniref:Uncharacterized protein n=1 Tax=Amborella trichopoda TaxID=13333 RepID=W1PL81_AMBTC|nr:hypothetical protein AMTR_s00017p00253730 [Amborella trichopoda]
MEEGGEWRMPGKAGEEGSSCEAGGEGCGGEKGGCDYGCLVDVFGHCFTRRSLMKWRGYMNNRNQGERERTRRRKGQENMRRGRCRGVGDGVVQEQGAGGACGGGCEEGGWRDETSGRSCGKEGGERKG